MESSWEANSSSASQGISPILWNQNVHYHLTRASHLSLLLTVWIQSRLSSCFKLYFNITIPFMPRSFKLFLSLRLPNQNPVFTSPLTHMCHMPHCLALLDFITQIIVCEECMHVVKLHNMQFSALSCYFLNLSSKHLPLYWIFKHLNSVFFP